MSDNMKRVTLWFAIIIVLPVGTMSQESDTIYTLTVFVGGGYSRNVSKFPDQLQGLRRGGMGGTVRVMWKPEHLLRVGFETGITQVYYVEQRNVVSPFGPTNFTARLYTVPIMLTFSMPFSGGFEGYLRSTSYILISQTESFGNSVTGVVLSIGFSAAFSYMKPIGNDWAIGGELKWYRIEKSGDDNVMLHLILSYRFLEW